MKSVFTFRPIEDQAISFVLSSLILLSVSPACAEDYTASSNFPSPLLSDRPDNSTYANADRQARLDQIMHYVRHDVPAMLPGLPEMVREPSDYMARQFKGIEDGLSSDDDDSDSSGGSFASFFAPMFSLMHPADEEDLESAWITPGYHHEHGMLPFDDALVFGFSYRNIAFDNHLKFTVHPYYAQSWHSGEGFWGTEFTFGLGPGDGRSWGTIVVRYNNGNTDIMDSNTHGFDLHADLKFDEGWSFAAGAQSNEEGDLGNYAMLRWSMKLGK
jgi:hypothetical protein